MVYGLSATIKTTLLCAVFAVASRLKVMVTQLFVQFLQ
jgi:hypothetical protein